MVEYADQMAESWHDGETRDIDKEMMHLTLQIVAKTLFSANVEDDADEIELVDLPPEGLIATLRRVGVTRTLARLLLRFVRSGRR